MPRNKKALDLVLAIDFGASSTKVFYALSDGIISSLVLDPEVVRIPKSSLLAYEDSKICSSTPENETWVGVGDTYYAVGYLAATQFPGNAHLNDVKSRVAVVKVLSVIWAIATKHKLNAKILRVAITMLLPIGEYADREKLSTQLSQLSQKDIDTPTGQKKIKFLDIDCKPEGAGVYINYRDLLGEQVYREKIVSIMLGYRNTSALISDRGRVSSDPIMSDLGMRLMLSRVAESTSGLDRKRLLVAIVSSEKENGVQSLWSICKSKNSDIRSDELEQLKVAIAQAKEEYIALLHNWFCEILPEATDLIIFSGGTAEYLRSTLEENFTSTPLLFHGGVEVSQQKDPFNYESRLSDVCGLFDSYCRKVFKSFSFAFESNKLAKVS